MQKRIFCKDQAGLCVMGDGLASLESRKQAFRKGRLSFGAQPQLWSAGGVLQRSLRSAVERLSTVELGPPRLSRIIPPFQVPNGLESYLLNAFTATPRFVFGWITAGRTRPGWHLADCRLCLCSCWSSGSSGLHFLLLPTPPPWAIPSTLQLLAVLRAASTPLQCPTCIFSFCPFGVSWRVLSRLCYSSAQDRAFPLFSLLAEVTDQLGAHSGRSFSSRGQ